MSLFVRQALEGLEGKRGPAFSSEALPAFRAAAKCQPDPNVAERLNALAQAGALNFHKRGFPLPLAPELHRAFAKACQRHCKAQDLDWIRASMNLVPGSILDHALALATIEAALAQGATPPKAGWAGRVFSPDPWSCLWPMAARLDAPQLGEMARALGAWTGKAPPNFFFSLRKALKLPPGDVLPPEAPIVLSEACGACAKAFPLLLSRSQTEFFLLDLAEDSSMDAAEAGRCARALLDQGLPPHLLRSLSSQSPAAAKLAAWADAWELAQIGAPAPAKTSARL